MSKINCMYLHGFASAFDPENEKMSILSSHTNLSPFSYNTAAHFKNNLDAILEFIDQNEITLVIGCSLGGFYALEASARRNIFSVALNPAFEVRNGMLRHVGEYKNFKTGKLQNLTANAAQSYPVHATLGGNGIVIVEEGDDIINPVNSYNYFRNYYKITSKLGGSHRFDSLKEQMPYILQSYRQFLT